jgi:hypothetical protein
MCNIHNSLEILGKAASSLSSSTWDALNSNFGIAATGSFFGAVGGYVIVLVTNRRTEILTKIDRIKVATALTHSLFNLAYSLHKQHIYDLYQDYEESKTKFIEAKTGKTKNDVIRVPFNNMTLTLPYVDFELINSKLLRETGFAGRAFILATTLIRCLYDLREQLKYRHAILSEINRIAVESNLNIHDKACLYYGIKIETPTGDIYYENYSSVMKAIKAFTLDCIWFSKELTLELLENAKIESKKIFYRRPKFGSADYSDVDSKYMPNDADYKDWEEKFKKA